MSYFEFLELLSADQLNEIEVSDTEIRGKLRGRTIDGAQVLSTIRGDPEFARILAEHDVEFSGTIESDTFSNIFAPVLPVLIFVGAWIFIIRNMVARQGDLGISVARFVQAVKSYDKVSDKYGETTHH